MKMSRYLNEAKRYERVKEVTAKTATGVFRMRNCLYEMLKERMRNIEYR